MLRREHDLDEQAVGLDRDLRVRWLNDVFARYLGRPEDELIGRSVYEVFPTMENPNPRLRTVLETGRHLNVKGLPFIYPYEDGARSFFFDNAYVPILTVYALFVHANVPSALALARSGGSARTVYFP